MKKAQDLFEHNDGSAFKLSNRTVNKVARELASMFDTVLPFPWEIIAECLRGEPKEKYKESFIWTLLEFLEDERFDRIDGMAMNVMVENLLHMETSNGGD